jgi:tetrahydromethanopterin S-methyltransferase subunit A
MKRGWPPYPGDYRVLDAAGHIGVCVLTSEEFMEAVVAARPEGVAIVGTLFTENLGIERIISNLLASPHLSTLLVCGADSKQRVGHLPGQALISLMANGIDDHGRIVGAEGRRPFIKNLPIDIISRFRREVSVLDRIGEDQADRILSEISTVSGASCSTTRLTQPGQQPVAKTGGEPPPLVLDPEGYFVIFPDRSRNILRLEHYENDGTLAHLFEGNNAQGIYPTVIAEGLVSRLDHAAYLGAELARAEHALRTGDPYIQDHAPEPPSDNACGCG